MEGIERIKILASEIKDEALLEIVNYLISREDMNDKYLNEEKSLRQMIDFIMNEAKKKSKNNRAIVKDEVVFGWAIHYWDESNEELKLGKATESNIEKATESRKIKKSKIKSKDWNPEGQLTLFDLM